MNKPAKKPRYSATVRDRQNAGVVTYYPYQLAFGFSLRYWPDLFAPSLRIHIGPAKAWLYVKLRGNTR